MKSSNIQATIGIFVLSVPLSDNQPSSDPSNPSGTTSPVMTFQGTGQRPNQNSPDAIFQGTATVGPMTISFNGQAKPKPELSQPMNPNDPNNPSSPSGTYPSSPSGTSPSSTPKSPVFTVFGTGQDNVSKIQQNDNKKNLFIA